MGMFSHISLIFPYYIMGNIYVQLWDIRPVIRYVFGNCRSHNSNNLRREDWYQGNSNEEQRGELLQYRTDI